MRTGWILSAATAFVLLGVSVAAFLNPVWVGFEQDRLGVVPHGPVSDGPFAAGCANVDVPGISGSILHDLVLGGDFDVRFGDVKCRPLRAPLPGTTVLTDAERSHMRDVRSVFAGFGLLVIASVLVLVATWRRSRRADRAGWWRAVRAGAAGLAVVVAALGAVAVVAFDAAFELFHRLFFASGTYSFDPATSRLVQLFPDQFWSETTLAIGFVAMVLSIATWGLATRRVAAAARLTGPTSTARLRVGEEGVG